MCSYLLFMLSTYLIDLVAIFATTLLLYLILNEKMKEVRVYTNILVLNCIISYACTALNVISRPHFEIAGNLWIHISHAPVSFFPNCLQYWLAGLCSFALAFGILSLPIQFYYRWMLLCRHKHLSPHDLAKLGVATFGCAFVFLILFGASFYTSDWKHEDKSFLANNRFIFNRFNSNPTIIAGELNSICMLLIVILAGVFVFCICVMIGFFTVGICRELGLVYSRMTQKKRHLERQINLAFFTQTIATFVTILIPLSVLLALMFFNLNTDGFGSLISVVVSCIPALHPISTLICISRFRLRALALLFCVRTQPSRAPIMSIWHSSSVEPKHTYFVAI